MAPRLNTNDVINMSEGRVTATINGENIILIEATKVTAKGELNKEDVQTLGQRVTSSRVVGITYSGSIEHYYVSSDFSKILVEYEKTGYLPEMSLTGTMEDPASSVGRQTVRLGKFMPNSIDLLKLETGDGWATGEMDFTFESAEIVEAFKGPQR